MIAARGLTRAFDGHVAVESVSFDVPSGKLFALLGPNGAGKTTTVRMLLGLIGPTAGSAVVAGHTLGASPETNSALRAACGLLTEAPGFYERLSAWENLLFFGRLYGMADGRIKQRAIHYLHTMDLYDRRDDPVGQYSKGMKQRLAIIRAVFHDPQVVFFDEPTAGLDPEAALTVRDLILGLKGEGRTIVVCTHHLEEAERLADLVGILKQRLLVCDTLDRLRAGAGEPAAVRVELTSDAAPLAPAARAVAGVGDVVAAGTVLHAHVADPRATVPPLVAALVAAGAAIVAVRNDAPTLEAIYLHTLRTEH